MSYVAKHTEGGGGGGGGGDCESGCGSTVEPLYKGHSE